VLCVLHSSISDSGSSSVINAVVVCDQEAADAQTQCAQSCTVCAVALCCSQSKLCHSAMELFVLTACAVKFGLHD
jgi:hypothetical protein